MHLASSATASVLGIIRVTFRNVISNMMKGVVCWIWPVWEQHQVRNLPMHRSATNRHRGFRKYGLLTLPMFLVFVYDLLSVHLNFLLSG